MCKSKGRQKSLKEREAQKSILRKIKYTYNREKPLKFRDKRSNSRGILNFRGREN